jgi:hypothetical protein
MFLPMLLVMSTRELVPGICPVITGQIWGGDGTELVAGGSG